MRRSFRPCVRRRPSTYGLAVLHELRFAEIRQAQLNGSECGRDLSVAVCLKGCRGAVVAPLFVRHQHSAGSVALAGNFYERYRYRLTLRTSFFDQSVCQALRELALLVGSAAFEHGYMDHGHGFGLLT